MAWPGICAACCTLGKVLTWWPPAWYALDRVDDEMSRACALRLLQGQKMLTWQLCDSGIS